MNYPDEPPLKQFIALLLVFALLVVLGVGHRLFTKQPSEGIVGRLVAYKAITPPISFKATTLGDYIWEKAVENGLDPYEVLYTVDCESGFDPNAKNVNKNGTIDIGIFQINSVHGISEELRYDPYFSTEWALEKWKTDPSIWVCYDKIFAKKVL